MSVAVEQRQRPDGWLAHLREFGSRLPHGFSFGVLLIAWLLLFHFLGNSVHGYFKTHSLFGWMGLTYSNLPDDRIGFYIPFVVCGILWWKRRELAALPKAPSWIGVGVVVAGLLIHVVGYLVQQSRISIGGFYFGLWGLVGAVWGTAVLRATFFPFCLLVFCVPLGAVTDTVTLPLRQLATTITVKICHWILGIPVQQAGSGATAILDPAGRYNYEVAAACSGIRSLTAMFALTAGYAFIFFNRWWKRTAILASAIPLAIISNVLRLLSIILAAELAGQQAGNYVHESTVISLLPYIVGFVGLFLLGRWMNEDCDVDLRALIIPIAVSVGVFLGAEWLATLALKGLVSKDSMATVFVAVIAIAVGVVFFRTGWRDVLGRPAISVGIVSLLMISLAAGLLANRRVYQRLTKPGVKMVAEPMYTVDATGSNAVLLSETSVYLPTNVLNYKSRSYPLSKVVYDWLPKDTSYGQRLYIAPDGFMVNNIVVLMGADRTSIHEPQYCLTTQGFTVLSQEKDTIRMQRPVPYDLPVMKMRFAGRLRDANGETRDTSGVFVYWFVSETNISSEHGKRMWQMGWNMIRTGVLERWAYVIAMAFTPVGQEEAGYERLREFIQASVPEYQLTVGQAVTELTQAEPNGMGK